MEFAEPAEHVEPGDPLFDDFFPFLVREGNREVPFRKSRVYRAHLTAWSRRSPADNAKDVRQLVKRLKALRKSDADLRAALKAPIPPELAALGIQPGDIRGKEELFVRSLTDALWFRAADDLPLWCLVADAAFSPRHWRELRAHNPNLAFAVEHLCRPEVDKTVGRKPDVRSEPPSPETQRTMRARAAFLLPELKKARRQSKREAVEALQKMLAGSKIPGLARRLPELGIYHHQSTNTYHVGKHRPKDIVIWIVANEFKISLPITKKILSGVRA